MTPDKNKIKLTANLSEIIYKMRVGWGLAKSSSFVTNRTTRNNVWLQEGGIGKGGKSLKVRTQTLATLLRLGIVEIAHVRGYSTRTEYGLTNLGKSIEL